MSSSFLIPLFSVQEYMLPCLNKTLFGVACPGCGMQRALYLLSTGEFAAAFHRYPAIYPLGILLLFLGLRFFVKIRYARTISLVLLTVTTATIAVNYMVKMTAFGCKL